MDDAGAMLWGRVTYELMEGYWPAVARGEEAVVAGGGRAARDVSLPSSAGRQHLSASGASCGASSWLPRASPPP